MRLVKAILVLAVLLGLAGCTFESDKVMTDVNAAGDEIAGYPSDKAFVIESFDRAKQSYQAFARVTPETVRGQGIHYSFRFGDGSPMFVTVRARKISEDNYLVRYAQIQDGVATTLNESGLVFVRHDGGTYYVLTGISSQPMLDRIFVGETPLELGTSVVRLETDHQADRISAYFRDHFEDFPRDQDYARMRIVQ